MLAICDLSGVYSIDVLVDSANIKVGWRGIHLQSLHDGGAIAARQTSGALEALLNLFDRQRFYGGFPL